MLEHTNSQSEAVLERFNSVLTPPLAGRRGVGRAVQGAVPRQVMPSLFKWLYQPFTKDDEPDVIPIEQRVYSGDMIIYEGEHGRLDKLVGGRGQAHRRGGMQSRSSCCKPGPEARSRACQKGTAWPSSRSSASWRASRAGTTKKVKHRTRQRRG